MSTSKENIINKAFELLKFIIPVVGKFPRSAKFTLGDRIENMTADILEILIEAYYSPVNEKRKLLTKTNVLLEKLRLFSRLAYELGHYNSLKYHEIAQRIDEIGRMCGGWLKSLPKN
jgi:hypothetical protein